MRQRRLIGAPARLGLALVVIMALAVAGVGHAAPPPAMPFTLGLSTQGRPITGVRVGGGARKLALIGDTHGGPEANTYQLVMQLAAYFTEHPDQVPADVRLLIVPTVNPDGLALGVRQNANGVDLNRNLDTSADTCPENDWQHIVEGAYGIVSPTGGPYAESEAESRIVRDFLLDANAVIFFHSNAGVVFPACDHPPSITLARVYADGAGYEFVPKWNKYAITGGMHDWAGGLGIAAVTPELVSGDLPEFEQNLAGVRAVLAGGAGLLPLPAPRTVSGVAVQPVIWRAWRAWGGAALFGSPLAPPVATATGWQQLFERAEFTYTPAQSDSTHSVELGLLGRATLAALPPPAAPLTATQYFSATGHNLAPPFADYWQINGGLPIFGLPLTEAMTATGDVALRQVFERAVLIQDRAGRIRPAPLGRQQWAHNDARNPLVRLRAR